MDLGIAGKTDIVCASSKGLGKACALSLAREGVAVTINSRTASELEETAEEIRHDSGATVIAVACDVTSPEGQEELLLACPQPDILVNNAGGAATRGFSRLGQTGLGGRCHGQYDYADRAYKGNRRWYDRA